MPHGSRFAGRAVLYSLWKLNGLPLQVNGLVSAKPLAADACMNPLWPVVRSVSLTSKTRPLAVRASNMWTLIRSPGRISSVCAFGVNVARLDSWGLGGPVGTPLVWIQAKFTGSKQLSLHGPAVNPWPRHSRLSMLSAEHQ